MAEWRMMVMLFESNVLLSEIKLDTGTRPELLTATWNYHDKLIAAKMLEWVMRVEKHVVYFGYSTIHEGMETDKTFEDACRRCGNEILKLAMQLSEGHQFDLHANAIIFCPPKDINVKLNPYFALNDHTVARLYNFLNIVLGSYSKERIARETSPFFKTPLKYIEFEPSLENKQMSKNLVEINNIVQYREINALLKVISNQDRIIFHKQRLDINDDYHMSKDESAVDSIVYCVKSSLATLEKLPEELKEKLTKNGYDIKEMIKPHIIFQRKSLSQLLPEEENMYLLEIWNQQEKLAKIIKLLYKSICVDFLSLAHKEKIVLDEGQNLEDLGVMLKIKTK